MTNKTVPPFVLGVDLDGTCADFYGGLRPIAAEWLGVDPEMLRAELKRIRQQGYAVDDREIYDDLRCVAVPLRNRRGDVVAALSLAGNTADLTAERVPEIVALLGEQSAELMRKLFPAAPGRLTN